MDPDEWFMPPQTVNAYYNPQRNEIVFPAAILQPPFFDPEADDALNYGGIGAVIGHEMIHGYDDQGSRFDPKGNFENWWTEADAAGFSALTGQLIEQFNAYEAAPGQFVDGKLTLGENIADLGGLAVAYDALQRAREGEADPMIDGLSQDQRFFLNWATVWRRSFTPEELTVRLATDSHAPAAFRAVGPPSNQPAYAAVPVQGRRPHGPRWRRPHRHLALAGRTADACAGPLLNCRPPPASVATEDAHVPAFRPVLAAAAVLWLAWLPTPGPRCGAPASRRPHRLHRFLQLHHASGCKQTRCPPGVASAALQELRDLTGRQQLAAGPGDERTGQRTSSCGQLLGQHLTRRRWRRLQADRPAAARIDGMRRARDIALTSPPCTSASGAVHFSADLT